MWFEYLDKFESILAVVALVFNVYVTGCPGDHTHKWRLRLSAISDPAHICLDLAALSTPA